MTYGTLNDLVARLNTSLRETGARPLAILAGSGVTLGSVPGVVEIIKAARQALPADDQAELDDLLAKHSSSGEKYQNAFQFLALRRSPDYRDRIIRASVLRAYKRRPEMVSDLDGAKLQEYEADADGWRLTSGVEALGRILAGLPVTQRGPVVTTNFDPLFEVAIRKAGASPFPRVMDADGDFLRDVRIADFPQIVHIHGYWRESSTLNMTSQLDQQRPALAGSLRALLNDYTLLVVGYSGWPDAVMRQFAQIIAEGSARDLDVLWAYYGTETSLESELEDNRFLSELRKASGNVQFYCDVDSNLLFPDLERAIADILEFPDEARRASGRGSLLGWSPVPVAEKTRRPLEEDRTRALAFFDGQLPTWHEAGNPLVPDRDVVRTVTNEVISFARSKDPSLSVIIGPSGEGKSCALMQAASRIAGDSSLTVLFREDGQLGSLSQIQELPVGTPHVLVVDDLFRDLSRLRELARNIHSHRLRDVHIVISARDTDWASEGGNAFPWAQYMRFSKHMIRGVSRLDAAAIIQSWELIGPDALGKLDSLPNTEQRIQALMDAAQDETDREEGALLGALLLTRLGDGLVDHVRLLMARLQERVVEGSHSAVTLLDALVFIALPHAEGVRSLGVPVLAEAWGLTSEEVRWGAVRPLGEEAAVSFTSHSLLVRHRRIAEAAISVSGEFGVQLDAVVKSLVVAAVRCVERTGMTPELHRIAYLSQSLRESALRVVAAEAAVEAQPRRISYKTSLSRALRSAGRRYDAAVLMRETSSLWHHAQDVDTGFRPYLTEWAVAEGSLGHHELNTVLAAGALQDMPVVGDLFQDQADVALNCFALGLSRAWTRARTDALLRALAALDYLFADSGIKGQAKERVMEAGNLAFTNGSRAPRSEEEALSWLGDACRGLAHELKDELPPGLPPLNFQFRGLARLYALHSHG